MALQDEPTPLVLRHEPIYSYLSWGENWLALNPAIGYSLGWSVASDGLFRWIGGDGEVAIESVWWRDGTLDHGSLQFHNQVGEGWLVLASPSAWAAVRARLGPVERRVAIRRSLQRDGSDGDQVGRAWRSVPVGDD